MLKNFLLFSFLILFQISVFSQKPQSVTHYYPNGKIQAKGKESGQVKTGLWMYYAEGGFLERKEKWKNGSLSWTLLYNEKHQKVKWINSDGTERKFKGCNCKN